MTHNSQHNRRKLRVVESPKEEDSGLRYRDLPKSTQRTIANVAMVALVAIPAGVFVISGSIDSSSDRAAKKQLSERKKAEKQASKYVNAVARLGMTTQIEIPAGAGEGYAVDAANDVAILNELTQGAAEKYVSKHAPGGSLTANELVEVPSLPFDPKTGKLRAVITEEGVKISPPADPKYVQQ